jgi:hypothetical protein
MVHALCELIICSSLMQFYGDMIYFLHNFLLSVSNKAHVKKDVADKCRTARNNNNGLKPVNDRNAVIEREHNDI